jgi:hypothetical protein
VGNQIKPYLDLEVKKRSGKIFAIDEQFKEANHLCRYKGLPLFKATVTIMNEYNEIRTQFHVVSDGHHQYVCPIEAMVKTIAAWGQEMPQYMYPDNPTREGIFLKHKYHHYNKSRTILTRWSFHWRRTGRRSQQGTLWLTTVTTFITTKQMK